MPEKEILRNQKWRLGIIRHAGEVAGNVAKTYLYYGISRTAFYQVIQKRYHNIEISPSGIWRILKRLGMNSRPNSIGMFWIKE